MIFTLALGGGGRIVLGVPFATFVAPGLIAMGMINNSFANSSFGLLVGKIQGTIIDYLMPPISNAELILALVAAAVTRAHVNTTGSPCVSRRCRGVGEGRDDARHRRRRAARLERHPQVRP
jgi:hypothetical protein